MTRVQDRKLPLGLGLLVVVLLANAAITYRNTRRLDDDARAVIYTQEVLDALGDLHTTARTAQAAERGYLLTNDRQFLEPYEDARQSSGDIIDRVGRLTADNPAQQARMPGLRDLVVAHYAQLGRAIAMQDRGDADAARREVQSARGKKIMDGMRDRIREMEAEETELLGVREQARGRAYTAAVAGGAGTLGFGLAAVAVVVWLGRRHLQDRAAVEAGRRRDERHAAAKISEAKFRDTLDRLGEGVCVVDAATGTFVEANAAVLTMLGYTHAEFVALAAFDIVAGETPAAFERNFRAMQQDLARDGRSDVGRRHLGRKDGTAVPVDIRVTVVPDGGAGLHAVVLRDVSDQVAAENRLFDYQMELEAANTRLRAFAVTDGLTGVKNRAAFDETLAAAFDRAARYGHPLSVVMIDVDYFKAFNDTFGHPAGDDVLKAVAAALQAAVRSTDVVARYGGEEFAVILPDTDADGAVVLAERCRREVAGADWGKRRVTVSVGVATLAGDATAAAVVKHADDALYRAKQGGRNRVAHAGSPIGVRTPAPA